MQYVGPRIHCSFCAYEIENTGRDCPSVPLATHVIGEGRGARQLCEAHALRGPWQAQARRAVAT